MRISLDKKVSRRLIAGVMLFAFAVRALVPQGFMPSGDRSFSVEICPEGFPAQLLTHTKHHHHGAGDSYTAHCVFGMASANGPPRPLTAPAAPLPAELDRPASCETPPLIVHFVYLPQSRGPPATV